MSVAEGEGTKQGVINVRTKDDDDGDEGVEGENAEKTCPGHLPSSPSPTFPSPSRFSPTLTWRNRLQGCHRTPPRPTLQRANTTLPLHPPHSGPVPALKSLLHFRDTRLLTYLGLPFHYTCIHSYHTQFHTLQAQRIHFTAPAISFCLEFPYIYISHFLGLSKLQRNGIV